MKVKTIDPMQKFGFLLGDWDMEYNIPKSQFSEATSGQGFGSFRRGLDNRYVFFDYKAKISDIPEGSAHGIFVWDDKIKIYRYWWFESSGNFMTATCSFPDDNTLFLNWHNSVLRQTFSRQGENTVVLRMEIPSSKDKYQLVLEVLFTRR